MILLVISDNGQVADKLALLFERYSQLLLRYTYDIVNSRQDAEDCVADTFVAVFNILMQSPGKVEDVASKRTGNFLITIAKNKALNILRRKKNFSLDDYVESLGQDLPDPVFSTVNLNETRQVINRLLSQMDDYKSTPLVLRYYHGCSVKEIAAIMEISENYVSVLLRRARAELKEALVDYAE